MTFDDLTIEREPRSPADAVPVNEPAASARASLRCEEDEIDGSLCDLPVGGSPDRPGLPSLRLH